MQAVDAEAVAVAGAMAVADVEAMVAVTAVAIADGSRGPAGSAPTVY